MGKFHGVTRRRHAHRFLHHQNAAVGLRGGNAVSADAPRLLGEPFDEGGAVSDLALGLVQRLALLGGQDAGQIAGVVQHERVPAFQKGGAVTGGAAAPGAESGGGGHDGVARLGGAAVGDGADHGPRRRVLDRQRLAGGGAGPLAADEGGVHQQGWVAKLDIRHDVGPQ